MKVNTNSYKEVYCRIHLIIVTPTSWVESVLKSNDRPYYKTVYYYISHFSCCCSRSCQLQKEPTTVR